MYQNDSLRLTLIFIFNNKDNISEYMNEMLLKYYLYRDLNLLQANLGMSQFEIIS